nr:MAG TPA: hypothetical protein [Caudoviricetes sp.]
MISFHLEFKSMYNLQGTIYNYCLPLMRLFYL